MDRAPSRRFYRSSYGSTYGRSSIRQNSAENCRIRANYSLMDRVKIIDEQGVKFVKNPMKMREIGPKKNS